MGTPLSKHAPPWARYKAKDADGTWHWFEAKPRWQKKLGIWWSRNGQVAPASEIHDELAPVETLEHN